MRVLVVDDSAFMRHAVSQILASSQGIQVVGTARDGIQALDLMEELQPDVVTLDVEMPRLDGLATLERIMRRQPVPVIMLSSFTAEGSSTTMAALELGAVDFVAKPSGPLSRTLQDMGLELATKVRSAARARVHARLIRTPPARASSATITASSQAFRRVLIIGSSTGGPKALCELVPALPGDLDAAVVIVQHMPAGFTRSLSERLDAMSALTIREAQTNDRLMRGLGLVAPGGRHLLVGSDGTVELSSDPPVLGVRPSVNVTMRSLVRVYGGDCLGVILTGMGSDGTVGCQEIRAAGGRVIAEAESTCVVFGMPRSVIESGAADRVVPLHDMAAQVVQTLADSSWPQHQRDCAPPRQRLAGPGREAR